MEFLTPVYDKPKIALSQHPVYDRKLESGAHKPQNGYPVYDKKVKKPYPVQRIIPVYSIYRGTPPWVHTIGFEITVTPQCGILFTRIPHKKLSNTATLQTQCSPRKVHNKISKFTTFEVDILENGKGMDPQSRDPNLLILFSHWVCLNEVG